jgi:DNA-binding transcriptional ArsR family regulator
MCVDVCAARDRVLPTAGRFAALRRHPLGQSSQPTVSHHLEVLLQAGLVEREQRGSWAYYRVVPEPLAALREVLA